MAVGIRELSGADSQIARLRAREYWSGPKQHGRAAANCCAALPVLVWALLLHQQVRPFRVNRDCRLGSSWQAQRMNWAMLWTRLAAAKAKSTPSLQCSVAQKAVRSRVPIPVQMAVRPPTAA
jgi:hypothetical protein